MQKYASNMHYMQKEIWKYLFKNMKKYAKNMQKYVSGQICKNM